MSRRVARVSLPSGKIKPITCFQLTSLADRLFDSSICLSFVQADHFNFGHARTRCVHWREDFFFFFTQLHGNRYRCSHRFKFTSNLPVSRIALLVIRFLLLYRFRIYRCLDRGKWMDQLGTFWYIFRFKMNCAEQRRGTSFIVLYVNYFNTEKKKNDVQIGK